MSRVYHPTTEKQKARSLRKQGFSLKEIAQDIHASKSTIRLWTKDVPLSVAARKRLYTKQLLGMITGANNQRERRLKEIEHITEKAKQEISSEINIETLKLLGAMLYWAEGDKTNHFAIANSDPLLIAFMVRWWDTIFTANGSQLIAHLNVYPQQDEAKLKKFWSELTSIPLENFGKTFVKPLNKKYKKNTLYYGTIKIRMKNGSDSRHRTFGWIKKLLHDMNIETKTVETRWNKLKTEYNRKF